MFQKIYDNFKKEILVHCLQRWTTYKIQNGHHGSTKWLTGCRKGSYPRALLFIFGVIFIFGVVFIFGTVFIFRVFSISGVVFIFGVVFILGVLFFSVVVFILGVISLNCWFFYSTDRPWSIKLGRISLEGYWCNQMYSSLLCNICDSNHSRWQHTHTYTEILI